MTEDLKNKPDSYWREKLTPEQYQFYAEKAQKPHIVASLLIMMMRVRIAALLVAENYF